ncbi:MAG: winged helix-turn-helix transcriptional regulator [Alphaproteobacteria bacterium]|nr:winged helix-turn-helix transcriptional regulator [Alphaproteobacteria bacterium]
MTAVAPAAQLLPHAAVRPLLEMGRLLGPRMTGRQMSVLVCLASADSPVQLRDVASQLRVPKPSAYRSVAALVRAGLAMRTASAGDRRDAPVAITPLGLGMIRDLSGCIGALAGPDGTAAARP